MVNPTSKAPIRFSYFPNVSDPTWIELRDGYRQAKPYTLNLPLISYSGKTMFENRLRLAANTTIASSDSIPASVKNRAYDKMIDQMRSSASLGAAIAEMSDSYAMVANRAKQLADFAHAVRRFEFSRAARVLRQSTIPKGVSKRKSFASNYLEFHFGWSPMIGDIYDAIDVLQNPISSHFPRGKASTGSIKYQQFPGAIPETGTKITGTWSGHVHAGCVVRITNPNLWLANQLGLINPASIAWEVVPFSFVVDWFVNVEQTLSSFTDFLGLSVTDPFTTLFYKQEALVTGGSRNPGSSRNVYKRTDRSTTLLRPTLALKSYKADNLRRALAQVSLLNNLFLEGRRTR